MDFDYVVIANIIGLWLATIVAIGGQTLMAYLIDMRPRVAVFGWGPVLLRARLGRLRVTLKALPFSGSVLSMTPITSVRLRLALYSSAGILANLAVFALGAWIMMRQRVLFTAWYAIPWSQLWFAGCAAIPFSSRKNPYRATNGLKFLRAVFGSQLFDVAGEYSKRLLEYPDARQPTSLSPGSREIMFQTIRRDRLTEAWARRDAYVTLRDILLQDRIEPAERLWVTQQLIAFELAYRDTGVTRAELDEWSGAALALSAATTLRVTRASALLLLGEFATAQALLLAALDADPSPADAMVSCAILAELSAKDQDIAGAQQWWNQARAHIPADQSAMLLPALEQLKRSAGWLKVRGNPAGAVPA